MDHNGNRLRIKIKVRNSNATAADTVDNNNCNKQHLCSITHMGFDCETTMDKGLSSFQPPTPVTTIRQSSHSSSPFASTVVDCSKFLVSWPLTGRRGRKSTSSITSTTTTTTATTDSKLNRKRVKVETHSDNKKSSKRKVDSEENKKNGVLEKEYKCNICSKVFSSPRALGGHKSSHYKANKTDITITKKIVSGTKLEPNMTLSLDSSTGRTDGKISTDFDLNELPPDDGEETILESCFSHP